MSWSSFLSWHRKLWRDHVGWYARTTQYAMFVVVPCIRSVLIELQPDIARVTLTHSNSAVWVTARYVNVKSIMLQWHLKPCRPWQNDIAISKLGILGYPQPVPSRFYSLVFNKQGGPDTVAPKVADCSSSWHFITETRHTFALLTHPHRFCYLRSMRDWEIPDWKLPSCSCLPFLSAIKGVGHMTRPPHLLLLYTLPAPILVSLPATPRTRANCSLTRPKPRAPKQQKQQQSTTPLQQKKRFLFSVSKKLPHDYSENIDWSWKLTIETRPTCYFSLAQSSQSLLWLTITQDQSTCSVSKASGASQNTLILERTKQTNKRTKQTNKQTNERPHPHSTRPRGFSAITLRDTSESVEEMRMPAQSVPAWTRGRHVWLTLKHNYHRGTLSVTTHRPATDTVCIIDSWQPQSLIYLCSKWKKNKTINKNNWKADLKQAGVTASVLKQDPNT